MRFLDKRHPPEPSLSSVSVQMERRVVRNSCSKFSFFYMFSSEAPVFPEWVWLVVCGTVILLCEGVYTEVSSRGYICFVDRYIYGGSRICVLDQFLSFHKSYSAAGERVKRGSFLVRASCQVNSVKKENGGKWPLCSPLKLKPCDIHFS